MCSVPRGIPRYISFPSSVIPRFLRPVRGTLVPRFLLPVLLHESFPCSLPSRRVLPFPRTFLHDLLSPVHPEVVPVLPQFPSQAFYRYDQYCFHIISFSIVFPFFVSFSLSLVPASYAGFLPVFFLC